MLIALLPAVLGLLFTTVGDGIVFKYWLQSFYPNLVELNQTAKEINFIKVMNELDGITFGKPESWVVLAADAWRRWSATSSNLIFFGCIAISVICGYLALKKVSPDVQSKKPCRENCFMDPWFKLASCNFDNDRNRAFGLI